MHEKDAAKMDEFLNNVLSHFSGDEFEDFLFLIEKMAKSAEEELKKMDDGGE